MASAPMSQRPVSLFTATHPIPGAWNGTAPNTPAPLTEDVKTIGGYIGVGAGKVREMISGHSPSTGTTEGQQKTMGQTVTEKAAAILPESVLGYVAPGATTTVPPADSATQLDKQEELGTQDNHSPVTPSLPALMGKTVSPDQDVQEAVKNSKEDYVVPVNVTPSPSPTPLATTASPPPAPLLDSSASSPAPTHKKHSPVANAASHMLPKLPHNHKQEKQQSGNTDLDQLSTRAVGGGTSISSLSNTESSANTSIVPAANAIPPRPNPETLYPDVLLPNSKFSEDFTPLAEPSTPLANETQNGRRLPQAFVHRPPKEISPTSPTAPSAFKDTPSPSSPSKLSKDIPASPAKSKFRTSLRKLTHKRDGSNASASNGALSEGDISATESVGNGNGSGHRERRKLRRASHGQTTGQEKPGLVERIKNVVKPHPHEV